MNVGMFITSYFPDRCGGAEQQCRRLAEALVRQGHAVTVLTARSRPDIPRDVVENGVRVIRLARVEAWLGGRRPIRKPVSSSTDRIPPSRGRRFVRLRKWGGDALRTVNLWSFLAGSAWTIWRLRRDIDVWHAHVATLAAGWCALCAERLGIPAVCKGSNLPVFTEEPCIPRRRRLECARRRMHFIALTDEMKADLKANGVPVKRVAVIPNGLPIPAEGPRPDPGENGTVLYVANLTQPVANKAFDVLFDAWGKVLAERPRARLVVAGAGDAEPWRAFLRARNAEPSVEFLGKANDLAKRYRSAALLVLPSRREGMSNALLEAQGHGVPAVVSDIPGNVAVVVHEQTGLWVPVGDATALARAIVRLLDDGVLRAQMGRAAHERVAANFGIDAVAARVSGFYACILKEVRK